MNDEVTLRPFSHEVAGALAVLANNANVVAQLRDNFPHPYTIADARFWIDYCNESPGDGNYHQAIYFGEAIAGGIGIVRQVDIHRKGAEIGYWLGEPFWGKI